MRNEILSGLANNPALTKALREVFDKHFALDGIKADVSNAELGERVRSRLDGQELLDRVFREIASYQKSKDTKPTTNPAR